MRGWLMAVLMFVGAVVVFAAAPVPPAAACSCAVMTTQEYADAADLVATGTITGHDEPENPSNSAEDATWTVGLDAVYSGDAPATVQVLSAMSGASCGWDHVQVGQRIALFATLDGDAVRSNLCSGTAPLTPELESELTAALGAPTAVEPADDAPPQSDDEGEGGLTSRGVVGFVFLVAAAALLVVGAIRRRR